VDSAACFFLSRMRVGEKRKRNSERRKLSTAPIRYIIHHA
jgi:hypothetical protein